MAEAVAALETHGAQFAESGPEGLLDLFGDHQLFAIPRVRDTQLGERLGELGSLVEAPTREVVVDLDLVGVVGIEVDVESRGRPGSDLVRHLFVPASELVHEGHGLDAIRPTAGCRPESALVWPRPTNHPPAEMCTTSPIPCPTA